MKNSKNAFRGSPKILRINQVDAQQLRISVLYNNGSNRVLDFKKIFNQDWNIPFPGLSCAPESRQQMTSSRCDLDGESA